MPQVEKEKKPTGRIRRFVPILVVGVLAVAVFGSGLHRAIDFDAIASQYTSLQTYVGENPLVAGLAAVAFYAVFTTLCIPAGWLVTVTIGLIFGWLAGSVLVVIGATLGASVLFFATKLALADFFKARAGNLLNRMAAGFREDAWSYMLFLRLAPVFSFTLVNVVPAILNVPFRIYFLTTAVGIIPGTVAYAFAGEGLRSIVRARAEACAASVPPCGEGLSPGDLVTREIVIAFALLSVVALLPVVIKRVRGQKKLPE